MVNIVKLKMIPIMEQTNPAMPIPLLLLTLPIMAQINPGILSINPIPKQQQTTIDKIPSTRLAIWSPLVYSFRPSDTGA